MNLALLQEVCFVFLKESQPGPCIEAVVAPPADPSPCPLQCHLHLQCVWALSDLAKLFHPKCSPCVLTSYPASPYLSSFRLSPFIQAWQAEEPEPLFQEGVNAYFCTTGVSLPLLMQMVQQLLIRSLLKRLIWWGRLMPIFPKMDWALGKCSFFKRSMGSPSCSNQRADNSPFPPYIPVCSKAPQWSQGWHTQWFEGPVTWVDFF